MAHSLSAKKRVRQNAKKRHINRTRKSQVKTQIKQFKAAIAAGNVQAAGEKYRSLVSRLDKVSAAGTIHKKTAARRKSRLARLLNTLKTKTA